MAFFESENALEFLNELGETNLEGRLWFEVVDGVLELRLAHDRIDLPVVVVALAIGYIVFSPIGRVTGRSVYRATGVFRERAQLPHSRFVELTASSLRLAGPSGLQEGGFSHE